jgi:hypothetical protein
MKIKVTQKQFNLLLNNFHLIGDKGLGLTLNGKSAERLKLSENVSKHEVYHFKSVIGPK